jgi:hypothetical protein
MNGIDDKSVCWWLVEPPKALQGLRRWTIIQAMLPGISQWFVKLDKRQWYFGAEIFYF